MARRRTRPDPAAPPGAGVREDHDTPWKEVLDRFFLEFLAFFYPAVHAGIDRDRKYDVLEKELRKIQREAEVGARAADRLVRVWLRDGREAWILIHVEVQSTPDAHFGERMFVYYYRIFDRYQKPVVSLAVLADPSPTWRPDTYESAHFGAGVTLRFLTAKLLDWRDQQDALRETDNVFAVAVEAHLAALRTHGAPRSRLEAKWQIVRLLYERGYSREVVRALFRFVDWILTLPEEYDELFYRRLSEFEEETSMPYITSVERRAMKLGREEGLQAGLSTGREEGARQAKRDSVLQFLKARFGKLPSDLPARLDAVSDPAALDALIAAAATAADLDAFLIALA